MVLKEGDQKNPKNPSEPKKADSDSDSDSDNDNIFNKKYFENEKIQNAFIDYLKLRKSKKYTLTERAINSLIKKLKDIAKGNISKAEDIINNAIEGSWKSFYDSEK